MNRYAAKVIAKTITNEQIQKMFAMAKESIKDWTVTSNVNKGMSRGAAWNILTKGFDVNDPHIHILAKTNMVREFGEFLPEELKPAKKQRRAYAPIHQEPIF
jgi:hypothetical protein